MKSYREFLHEGSLNENNIISKLNKIKSELSPLSSLYIQSIIDDKGVIEDLNNTGNFVTIEDIKLWNLPKYGNRLTLTYRFYNKKFENGGYQTIASFYGDVDEILSNIEHLIFDVVRFKKKKFEDIKIDFKINNRVANKYQYRNRFNEALRKSVVNERIVKIADGKYNIKKTNFKFLQRVSKRGLEGIVFLGAGGDLNQWVNGINDLWNKDKIGSGLIEDKMMGLYQITTSGGRTDLVMIFKTNSQMEIGKLAMWRLRFGDASWLSDYVVNYRDQQLD